MCGIDFFYFGLVSVRFLEKNNLDLVWNEFGSVQSKKRRSVRLFTTHVIANITATVDDMMLMSLTTTTTNK